ncbi:hypothetical protein ACFL2H_13625 [Planctomycetota bacterium]
MSGRESNLTERAVSRAQFCIVSVCMSLMTMRFRLVMGIAIATILYSAFYLGLILAGPFSNYPLTEYVGFLFCGPIVLMGCQLPLLAARSYSGWRIMKIRALDCTTEVLGIRDVLIGTTLAAITLAMSRAGTALVDVGSVLPAIIVAGVSCLISALTSSRSCSATLGNRFRLYYLIVPLLTQILVVVGFLVIVTIIEGTRPPAEAYSVTSCLLLGYFTGTTGFFLSLRWAGWRLDTRSRPIVRLSSAVDRSDGQLSPALPIADLADLD